MAKIKRIRWKEEALNQIKSAYTDTRKPIRSLYNYKNSCITVFLVLHLKYGKINEQGRGGYAGLVEA